MIVYVLTRQWDCIDDGYDVGAVYESKEDIEKYLIEEYGDAVTKMHETQYQVDTTNTKYSKYTPILIFDIHEVNLIKKGDV